jgi:chromate transport protein ChrA
MKTMYATIISLLISATYALASNGGNGEGLSFLATLFIGFGILILVFQTVPAILLFTGLIKGLLSPADKKAHASDSSTNS